MPPAVTAIVPTYNRPELLGASIESALRQTYRDVVVLVGDNGGSPLTEGIVRGFDDPRVCYVRHEQSLGAQGNWLELIRRAETPLVASLHDDDTWEPTFLEKTVPLLADDPTTSIAFTDYWCVDDDGDRLVEHTEWLSRHSGRDALPAGRFTGSYDEGLRMVAVQGAPQPAYAAVLRRQAVLDTEFPDDISPIYDLWLAYRILSRGEGLAYVPERLTNYRVWGGSLTALGYGTGQDSVFARIVAENQRTHPAVDAVQEEWAQNRFRRARRGFDDPAERDQSRRELLLAAPYLTGRKLLIAEVAGHSALGWEAVRRLRELVRWVRFRVRPTTRTSSGLPESALRANDRARQLRR